nr:hypothetical protein [uncultured Mucilaginibacter sp.]
MKYLKRNSDNILFTIIFIASIVFYTSKIIDASAFIGALGAIATIYYGSLKLKIENDLVFKELFKTFNERYDNKMNDLINELKLDDRRSLTGKERNLIIDYFNLCAEEFLWTSKKRIPADIWKAWRAGIIENLKIKQIKDLFEKETETTYGKASYYGLYEELKKL